MKHILISAALITASLVVPSAYAACNGSITLTKPDSAFTDNGNGTITDKETGLMWMKCSQGLTDLNCSTGALTAFTWSDALTEAQTANVGMGTNGYTDWRLPSVAELGSIIESACDNPAINADYFPDVVAGTYWTSSPYYSSNDSAWKVHFAEGEESAAAKDNTYYVRLVRQGL